MDGQALSKALRTGGGLYLFCRRGIVLTSFVGGLSMMMHVLSDRGVGQLRGGTAGRARNVGCVAAA